MPKLDGLRAIAVLMVVIHHYSDELHFPISFKYGANGVQIFFTISGFLITYILLSQKNNNSGASKPKMVLSFMFKRALRLFPIYYIFLTILVVFSKIGGLWLGQENMEWYYYLYIQNILFYKFNFQSTLLNHTWSLAVEEQFYLLWPFLIFYIPKKIEFYLLLLIFSVGLVSKYYFINYYVGTGTIKGVTFTHFDTLGIGALLAHFVYYKNKIALNFLEKYASMLFLLTLALSIIFTIFQINTFLLGLFLAFMSFFLVYMSSSPRSYFIDSILNLRAFNYLGKISYGIYLYHKPVPFFFNYLSQKTHFFIESKILLFIIYISITLLISVLSWNTIEKFFLKFKSKID